MIELPASISDKSPAGIEEWFMSGMVRDPIPIREMTDVISCLVDSGQNQLAAGCADLLVDSLCTEEHLTDLIRVLTLRCRIATDTAELRNLCCNCLKKAFPARRAPVMLKNCGFESAVDTAECVRRIAVLTGLEPGVLCLDKTWGAGEVKHVDDFYEKVTIDFDRKNGHQMSFAYAAEALTIISADHVLALRRAQPETLKEIARQDPARLVLMIIEHLGPTSVDGVREIVEERVIPASDWKRFWDAARKSLRANPLVDIPAKRSDPIRVIESVADRDRENLSALAAERDPESVLKLIDTMAESGGEKGLSADRLAEASRRLAYVVRVSDPERLDLVARAAIMSRELGLPEMGDAGQEGVRADTVLRSLLAGDRFVRAARSMSGRNARDLIRMLAECDAGALADVLIARQAELNVGVLAESIEALASMGSGERCAEAMRGSFGARKAGMALLYWACRNIRRAVEWSVVSPVVLMEQVVDALCRNSSGEELKIQNQLSDLFEQANWLGDTLSMLDAGQRVVVLTKIRDAPMIDAGYARSLMARMIKMYPELADAAASGDVGEDAVRRDIRFTSWRSYNARTAQLQNLIEKEIPANSREIAVARSYGDLRENAEYKAAKEHQGILHRRRGEIENDLKEVKGTDFDGFPCEAAGVGTMVKLVRPNGESQTYCILGEWDRDESLGIISSLSRLAEILAGRRPGEKALIPATDGEEECVVGEVTPLPERVRTWIATSQERGN